MEALVKVWAFLSGKKTVTAAILKALADILTSAGKPEVAAVVDQVGNALLAFGLTHKAAKVGK